MVTTASAARRAPTSRGRNANETCKTSRPMGSLIQEYVARAFTRLPNTKAKPVVSPWTPTSSGGTGRLRRHLEAAYGMKVTWPTELDKGVFLVQRAKGRPWIARCFSRSRPMDCVRGDAELLRFLEEQSFPAERLAHTDAVTDCEGHGVLGTEFVTSREPGLSLSESMHLLGDLVGRMHVLSESGGAVARKAGGWHHLCLEGGGRDDDAALLLPMLNEARDEAPSDLASVYDTLIREVESIDPCLDLPQALTNIDIGAPNVLFCEQGPVVIDWTGAGRGARVLSLTSLLAGSEDMSLVDAFVEGYRNHVELDPAELNRLAGALSLHQLVLGAWMSIFVPDQAPRVVARLPDLHALCTAVAQRTSDALLGRKSRPQQKRSQTVTKPARRPTRRSALPLSALLSRAIFDLTIEFERAGAGSDEIVSAPEWFNLFQYVGNDGVDVSQLHMTSRVSRRVVRQVVERLQRSGLATVTTRSKILRLTDLGRERTGAFPALVTNVERRWARRVGGAAALRTALEQVVPQLDLELPHYPCQYGGSDSSVTGGPGIDWKPVPREQPSSVKRMPLMALLSQAWTAFAIDSESRGIWLHLSALILRLLPDGPFPLEELPSDIHLLDAHGNLHYGLARLMMLTGGHVQLNADGRQSRDAYLPATTAIERDWSARFGPEPVAALRHALQSIDKRLERDLPHHPPTDAFRLGGRVREGSGRRR
jgi:Ser/Thr protein kinase RdoA (MazF antagonist)